MLEKKIKREFTATTFIFCKGKTLLHFHPKFNKWLPPGGHIENNELPDQAAIREVFEETGLFIQLYNENKFFGNIDFELTRPLAILKEKISEFEEHIDLIYIAEIDNFVDLKNDFKWFSLENLDSDDIPNDVRILSLRGWNELKKSKNEIKAEDL